MLKRSGERGQLACTRPRGKGSSSPPLSVGSAADILVAIPIRLKFPLVPSLLSVLSHEWVWDFVEPVFLHLLMCSDDFSSSVAVTITLIDCQILGGPCTPGYSPPGRGIELF